MSRVRQGQNVGGLNEGKLTSYREDPIEKIRKGLMGLIQFPDAEM